MRGLKVCGFDIDAISSFVAFLVTRNIPDHLNSDWDTSNMDYGAYQSFDSLARLLNSHCLSYEKSTAISQSIQRMINHL